MQPFYNLQAKKANKEILGFKNLKDKMVLIVNTATKCGFTPQLEDLEGLYQRYKDQGLIVLGFPCNQFGHQNPEDDEKTVAECKLNFGVTFPMMQKSDVNGKNTNSVFQYLKKELRGLFGGRIMWNFTKFLISADGQPLKRYAPYTKIAQIESDIIQLLGDKKNI